MADKDNVFPIGMLILVSLNTTFDTNISCGSSLQKVSVSKEIKNAVPLLKVLILMVFRDLNE